MSRVCLEFPQWEHFKSFFCCFELELVELDLLRTPPFPDGLGPIFQSLGSQLSSCSFIKTISHHCLSYYFLLNAHIGLLSHRKWLHLLHSALDLVESIIKDIEEHIDPLLLENCGVQLHILRALHGVWPPKIYFPPQALQLVIKFLQRSTFFS